MPCCAQHGNSIKQGTCRQATEPHQDASPVRFFTLSSRAMLQQSRRARLSKGADLWGSRAVQQIQETVAAAQ